VGGGCFEFLQDGFGYQMRAFVGAAEVGPAPGFTQTGERELANNLPDIRPLIGEICEIVRAFDIDSASVVGEDESVTGGDARCLLVIVGEGVDWPTRTQTQSSGQVMAVAAAKTLTITVGDAWSGIVASDIAEGECRGHTLTIGVKTYAPGLGNRQSQLSG